MEFIVKLENGLIVTLLGIGTVFLILILLVFVLNLLKIFIYDTKNKSDKAEKNIDKLNIKSENNQNNIDIEQKKDDESELIAVITAAIAASLNTSTHNIVVRSIKKLPDNIPMWNKIARHEQLN